MINKLKNIREVNQEAPRKMFVMTIKNSITGETLYEEESEAGILCTIERSKKIVGSSIEAIHQVLFWGDILLQGHALIMLRDKFKDNIEGYIAEIKKRGIQVDTDAIERSLKRSVQ